MPEKRNSTIFLLIYDKCCEINISDHKLGKHFFIYFSIVAKLNEYGFQYSASFPSGMNWSRASWTRPSKAEDERSWQGTSRWTTACFEHRCFL